MSDKAFILRHQPYNPAEGYALNLQWEKPLLAIAETEPGPLPDPLIFEGDLAALEGNDYPSNSFHWPIMSRRMLDTLLSVGPFPHRTIPVGVRDKQTDQVDSEKYVAVQLTEHLDLFDRETSKYYYPYGDIVRFINSDEEEKVYQEQNYKFGKILSQIVLKASDKPLPAIFRLASYKWAVFISEKGRSALDNQVFKGIVFQDLDKPRNISEIDEDGELRLEPGASIDDLQLSPAELNAFASNYNWDDDNDVPIQIIRHPFCAKATALMVYWKAEPAFYATYESRDQIEEYFQENFDLIKEIERRYQNNFYYYKNISFDPKNDEGYDWTDDSDSTNATQNQKIPDIMYEATGPQ